MSDVDFKNVIEVMMIIDLIEKSNHPIKNDLIKFMNTLGELVNIKRLATENINDTDEEFVISSSEEETDEEWEH
jgi:hypothetical protein